MPPSFKRVARRYLERQGTGPYPEMNLRDDQDLDSWRDRPALPDGHSELPGDEDEDDEISEGLEGEWSRCA